MQYYLDVHSFTDHTDQRHQAAISISWFNQTVEYWHLYVCESVCARSIDLLTETSALILHLRATMEKAPQDINSS